MCPCLWTTNIQLYFKIFVSRFFQEAVYLNGSMKDWEWCGKIKIGEKSKMRGEENGYELCLIFEVRIKHNWILNKLSTRLPKVNVYISCNYFFLYLYNSSHIITKGKDGRHVWYVLTHFVQVSPWFQRLFRLLFSLVAANRTSVSKLL